MEKWIDAGVVCVKYMKLLFVDEFKKEKKTHKFYGLSVVLIDNSSYSRFKKGFYDKLLDCPALFILYKKIFKLRIFYAE